MKQILHITPHLGGGVGRALLSLVRADLQAGSPWSHEIICLEPPEKTNFLLEAQQLGVRLLVAPDSVALNRALKAADLVQLELWNHPVIMRFLCDNDLPAIRLLIWCHVSGLHFPRIALDWVALADSFVLTSACSLQSFEFAALPEKLRSRITVISSAAGLEDMPARKLVDGAAIDTGVCRFGYLGSLNFAKLHPDYVALLVAASMPGLRVRLVGDATNRVILQRQCEVLGRPDLLEFAGFRIDIASELIALDVMLYLLNPFHYGTAEIALLEAMAMGVVPVVLPNPAELQIVDHGVNGFVVRDEGELSAAIHVLSKEPSLRLAMGTRAASSVRTLYTKDKIATEFKKLYSEIFQKPKRLIRFDKIFGTQASGWFTGFLRDQSIFKPNGEVNLPSGPGSYHYLERTKGSVRHFQQVFREDELLRVWANNLTTNPMGNCS